MNRGTMPQLMDHHWASDQRMAPKGTWVVYQLLANDGAVLYVGVTSQLASRLSHHRGVRSHTRSFTTWVADTADDRADAYGAEAELIARLRPPLNTAGL